jgi:hypothetical protein
MNERANAFQPITPRNIENAVAFLQKIESLPPNQISKPGREPLDVEYDPIVWNLMKTFEQNGFVQPYNWSKWQLQAERIFKNPKLLEQADRPGAHEWMVWQGLAADKAEALQSAEKADPRVDLEWMRIRYERDLNKR